MSKRSEELILAEISSIQAEDKVDIKAIDQKQIEINQAEMIIKTCKNRIKFHETNILNNTKKISALRADLMLLKGQQKCGELVL